MSQELGFSPSFFFVPMHVTWLDVTGDRLTFVGKKVVKIERVFEAYAES